MQAPQTYTASIDVLYSTARAHVCTRYHILLGGVPALHVIHILIFVAWGGAQVVTFATIITCAAPGVQLVLAIVNVPVYCKFARSAR